MKEDLKKALAAAQVVKRTNLALITELEDEIWGLRQVINKTTAYMESIEKQLKDIDDEYSSSNCGCDI